MNNDRRIAVDQIMRRVFARVVEELRRPLTDCESSTLATACGLVGLAGPAEAASLEAYTVRRALELAQR
jgi:hypothetical protein